MTNREELRIQMARNAETINDLHRRIHETYSARSEGTELRQQWSLACEEFHRRYSQLCVPGGWDSGFMDRLKAGEYHTVEAVLCFLEVRPYFFRSGYLWKDLLRKCKRIPMNAEQSSRFLALLDRYSEWKATRAEQAMRGAKVRTHAHKLFARFERLFPVCFRDSELDGVTTVGALYAVLCRHLKIDAPKEPEKLAGIVRKPYSPGKFVRPPIMEMYRSEGYSRSSWNAADIWATLVATIRDVYSLSSEFSITVRTNLPSIRRN